MCSQCVYILLTMSHTVVGSNSTNAIEQCLPFYYLPFTYIRLWNGYKNGNNSIIYPHGIITFPRTLWLQSEQDFEIYLVFVSILYRLSLSTFQFRSRKLSRRSKPVWSVNWKRNSPANMWCSLVTVKSYRNHNVTPVIHWSRSVHVPEHWPLCSTPFWRIWCSQPKLLANVFASSWTVPNWSRFIWIKINKPPLNTR